MLPIIVLLVLAGIKTVVYGVLLWILARIQGLQHTFAGLLLCSIVATVISLIPVVGPYLAYAALLLCLRKVTHAEIFPDCAFTAVIANSLMFVLGLWLVGALMGRLCPDQLVEARSRSALVADATEEDAGAKPEQAQPVLTPPAVKAKVNPNAQGLTLKGISVGPSGQTAMLCLGRSYETVGLGGVVNMRGPEGLIPVRCEEISRSAVVLTVNGGEKVKLEIQ